MTEPHSPSEISATDDTLHRLLDVSRRLSASADLREILTVIIDAMRDLLHADRATVFEYDSDSHELFSTVAHLKTTEVGDATEIRIPADTGLAGEAATKRAIVNVEDAHADERFNPDVDRRTGYRTRSLLTIPLVGYDGVLVGVAQVLNKSGGPFTSDDEEIAAALAAHAAVAIKRGRLIQDQIMREKLERDLKVAREIQQKCFPRSLPDVAGFDIDAWSEPADATGGDMFDVIPLSQTQEETSTDATSGVMLLLADASGHGVGPALSVTQVRAMLRVATRLQTPLSEIAEHVNAQVHHDLPSGRFVTAWFGELDAASATLSSFSAGQAPLFHYHASDQSVDVLMSDAAPLGVLDELSAHNMVQIVLAPGDIFAVISDGVFEQRNVAEVEFGADAVIDIISNSASATASEISNNIRDALRGFARGREIDDDCTAVILKRR